MQINVILYSPSHLWKNAPFWRKWRVIAQASQELDDETWLKIILCFDDVIIIIIIIIITMLYFRLIITIIIVIVIIIIIIITTTIYTF